MRACRSTGVWLLLSLLLFRTRYVRYFNYGYLMDAFHDFFLGFLVIVYLQLLVPVLYGKKGVNILSCSF